jgi:hypothetical protein
MKAKLMVVLVGLLVFPALVWSASDFTKTQNKLLAKRAAEVDCYRKLAERIKGLRINSNTLVRDFVTQSDEIQTEFDTFIKGIRLGKPRYYDDGSCEVTGEVTYQKVVATITEIHNRKYVNDHFRGSDFSEMATRKEISVIKATGSGAPRPDNPIDQPDGTVSEAVPEDLPTPSIPNLWKKIGPQGRLMAKRAAELDAYRRLGEQLRGFRISSKTSVRDFVTEYDDIQTELNSTLMGAREVHVYYHSDEPIVEVTMEIPWQKVLATIRDAVTTHIKDDHIKKSVYNETTSRVEKKYFRATGMGIPPERFLERAKPAMIIAPPDWMSKPITATGESVIDAKNGNSQQAYLMAARGAELDAKRKLAETIGELQVQNEQSVGNFITKHDVIRTQMDTVIDGAYVKKTEKMDGKVRVTVEIPGSRVWNVLSSEMHIKSGTSDKGASDE